MVNSMVERATSDLLIGPDWAMNIEICDICNRDPVQAKDVVRGIKKRINSRNPRVQLLALTLLETIIKNCGDIVHMHVAEKDLLHEMVKIVRKKPDFHVKEKILVLIDTWQEVFGGARARYPQYYAAYQELLRMGAVFPQRSENAPVFTPPQTQPLSSYPQNLRNSEPGPQAAESSAEPEFPTLRYTGTARLFLAFAKTNASKLFCLLLYQRGSFFPFFCRFAFLVKQGFHITKTTQLMGETCGFVKLWAYFSIAPDPYYEIEYHMYLNK